MRAILIREYGPVDSHRVEEVPEPVPGDEEVLIDVHAAGINYPDALMLQGLYQKRPELPFVPGRDAAGTVISTGRSVTGFRPGQRVVAQVFSGAFAEQLAAPVSRCFPLPAGTGFVDAAAMITVFNTAYVATALRGQVRAGEQVLVTGAAGGVGLAAVQLAKARGAGVIAAVSTQEKAALARDNGADHVIFTGADDLKASFREQVLPLTGGRGVDVAIDTVGGDVFQACLRVLAFAGRVVIVGFSSGTIPEARANYLLYRNLAVLGAPLDIHFDHAREQMVQGVEETFRLKREGKVRANVTRTFPLGEFADAFRLITGRQARGKVVLTMKAQEGTA